MADYLDILKKSPLGQFVAVIIPAVGIIWTTFHFIYQSKIDVIESKIDVIEHAGSAKVNVAKAEFGQKITKLQGELNQCLLDLQLISEKRKAEQGLIKREKRLLDERGQFLDEKRKMLASQIAPDLELDSLNLKLEFMLGRAKQVRDLDTKKK